MTDCPVARCDRPTQPGWTVCKACAGDLERAVAEVPALTEELAITLTRQNSHGAGSGSRNAEVPLPYDARSSEAAWVLRNTLVGWIRDVEPDIARHPVDTMPAMAHWLLCHFGRLLVHPAGAEAVDEITNAVRHAWSTVDNPPERVFLGRCPTCGLADLYAAPGKTEVACRECGDRHDVAEQRARLSAALDELAVTGPEFAGYAIAHLGIPVDRDRLEGRVHTWAARGLIHSVGHIARNGAAAPTYRFSDLRGRLDQGRSA